MEGSYWLVHTHRGVCTPIENRPRPHQQLVVVDISSAPLPRATGPKTRAPWRGGEMGKTGGREGEEGRGGREERKGEGRGG